MSAENERAVGHWVDVKYDCAVCSECGKDIWTHFDTSEQAYYGWRELYPYCPWCGARMEPSEFHWKYAPTKGKTKCKCN